MFGQSFFALENAPHDERKGVRHGRDDEDDQKRQRARREVVGKQHRGQKHGGIKRAQHCPARALQRTALMVEHQKAQKRQSEDKSEDEHAAVSDPFARKPFHEVINGGKERRKRKHGDLLRQRHFECGRFFRSVFLHFPIRKSVHHFIRADEGKGIHEYAEKPRVDIPQKEEPDDDADIEDAGDESLFHLIPLLRCRNACRARNSFRWRVRDPFSKTPATSFWKNTVRNTPPDTAKSWKGAPPRPCV